MLSESILNLETVHYCIITTVKVRQTLTVTDNISARGTSEPGDLGQIVGDPLVARVKRDLKDATAQGYPVQVRRNALTVNHVSYSLVL